jgi:hypothetical protein
VGIQTELGGIFFGGSYRWIMDHTPMIRTILPPYLTTSGGAKRCSPCEQTFDRNAQSSLGAPFASILRKSIVPAKNLTNRSIPICISSGALSRSIS